VWEQRLCGTGIVRSQQRATGITLRASGSDGEDRRRRRFITASCWRSARFSSASSERSRRVVGIRESSRRIIRVTPGKCRVPRHRKSMRPQLRRRHFSRHITFYQHLREGTHGGPRAAGSEAWQAKRQLILPIRPAQRRCGIQNDTQLLRQRRQATRRREIEQGGWKRAFFSILAHLFLQITSANVSVLLLEETSVQCRPARDGGEEPVAGQTRCDQSDK